MIAALAAQRTGLLYTQRVSTANLQTIYLTHGHDAWNLGIEGPFSRLPVMIKAASDTAQTSYGQVDVRLYFPANSQTVASAGQAKRDI